MLFILGETRMRTAVLIVFIFAAVLLAQSPSQLFQQALLKENGEGDLAAAVTLYEKIAGDETAGRALRAKAQLHIGICWEKMGKSEAGKAYEAVIIRFPEQEEVAAAAKEKLRTLKKNIDDIKIFYPPYQELLRSDQKIWGIAFSPNGTWMAVGSGDKIWLYQAANIQNRTLLLDSLAQNRINLAWSPGGHYISYIADAPEGEKTSLYCARVDAEQGRLLTLPECIIEENGLFGYDWNDTESEIVYFSNNPPSISSYSIAKRNKTWSRPSKSFIFFAKWAQRPGSLYYTIRDSANVLITLLLDPANGVESTLLSGQPLFDLTAGRRYGALFSIGENANGVALGIYATEKDQVVQVAMPKGVERLHYGRLDSHSGSFIVPAFTEIGQIKKYDLSTGKTSLFSPLDGYFHSPLYSSDGNSILYAQFDAGKNQLFVKDLVHGTTRTVPINSMFGWPSWSADGRYIAFHCRNNLNEPWKINTLELATLKGETLDVAIDQVLCWSPAEASFAYARDVSGEKQLVVSNAEGKKKVLFTSAAAISLAGWQKNGAHLMIAVADSSGSAILEGDPASGKTRICFKSQHVMQSPKLSHDGTSIAYVYQDRDNNQQLRVVRIDGSADRILSQKSGHYFSGKYLWLPDDSALIDQLVTDARSSYISRFNITDQSEQLLIDEGNRRYITVLSLAPDGGRLVYDCWYVDDTATLYKIDLSEVWHYFGEN